MSTPKRFGTEFLIDTSPTSIEYLPAMTALPDGRFVVTWTEREETGDHNVRAQVFNADGSKSGADFLVNDNTTGFQGAPVVTTLTDGRVVVSWTDGSRSAGDTSGAAIRAQVLDADGSSAGSNFLLNTMTEGDQFHPVVTALVDGRFVVSWVQRSDRGGIGEYDLQAQVFNADGSKSGGEFRINPTPANQHSAITALADGGFVVTWEESEGTEDVPGYDIRARIFDAAGAPSGPDFLVNTTVTGYQLNPATTVLVDGRFIVTWLDGSYSTGYPREDAVRAQLFNADGSKSGEEFLVATTTSPRTAPIAALPDGRFVVAWTEREGFSSPDIQAQVFNADGSKAGAAFIVNATTAGFQGDPAITVLADDRFAVTWSDYRPITRDGDYLNGIVLGQIFDPRIGPVHLNGTAADDDYYGTRFDDVMHGAGGNDILGGGAGNDELKGQSGHDWLFGGTGNDDLHGGAGNDVLNGGAGNDFMTGGAGNDRYIVNAAGDCIIEQPGGGKDLVQSAVISLDLFDYSEVENASLLGKRTLDLTGSDGNNILTGNNAANVIRGLGGHDRLMGNGGNDILLGGSGRDRLDGGAGDDVLTGGGGKDIFVFAGSHGTAEITDFQDGVDRIDLSAFGFTTAQAAIGVAADTGTDVVFTFAPSNVLTVANTSMVQLTDLDFIL